MSHWIKMKVDLSTNPKVVRISSALKADRLRTVGALHAVWSLFDTHSENGELVGYSPEILDEMIGWKGFSTAMISVEWLSIDGNSLIMKDYDENNGTSAKKRAQDSVRKMSARKADKHPIPVHAEMGPEKEKDKSKNNTPIVPTGDNALADSQDSDKSAPDQSLSADFLSFWKAYPEKKEKRAAWKAWERIKHRPATEVLIEAVRLQEVDRAQARSRNEFYPEWKNPATWLSAGCWDDQLKYAQKKEKAAGSIVPSNWREILIDRYPQNFPDGITGANFPSGFSLLPASVQAEVMEHAALVGKISEAIHANQNKEAA
jgi:hypothetical protein